jgi:hypothetical protein
LRLREDRSFGTFTEATDRSIAIDAHYEPITETPRLTQRADVSCVEQVEAPVREDDREAGASVCGNRLAKRGAIDNPTHRASLLRRRP